MKQLKNPILFILEDGSGTKNKDCIVGRISKKQGTNERNYESMIEEAEKFIKSELNVHPERRFYVVYGDCLIPNVEIVVKLEP